MKIKTQRNNFTELELHQIKVIDKLQEEIKTLKLEITDLNKDIDAYKLVINIKDNTIERLQKLLKAEMKENKILRENAEHNDKVVDKVNWEINVLKHNRDKALKFIKENSYKKGDGTIMYDTDIQELEDILKGDSDE